MSRGGPKKKWGKAEHDKLMELIEEAGRNGKFYKWPEIAEALGTGRSGRQCRERCKNFRMDARRGVWDSAEEDTLAEWHAAHGPEWTFITQECGIQRSTDAIKNHFRVLQRAPSLDDRGESLLIWYITCLRAGAPEGKALDYAKDLRRMYGSSDPKRPRVRFSVAVRAYLEASGEFKPQDAWLQDLPAGGSPCQGEREQDLVTTSGTHTGEQRAGAGGWHQLDTAGTGSQPAKRQRMSPADSDTTRTVSEPGCAAQTPPVPVRAAEPQHSGHGAGGTLAAANSVQTHVGAGSTPSPKASIPTEVPAIPAPATQTAVPAPDLADSAVHVKAQPQPAPQPAQRPRTLPEILLATKLSKPAHRPIPKPQVYSKPVNSGAGDKGGSNKGPGSKSGPAHWPSVSGGPHPVRCDCGLPALGNVSMLPDTAGRVYYTCSKPPTESTRCRFLLWLGNEKPARAPKAVCDVLMESPFGCADSVLQHTADPLPVIERDPRIKSPKPQASKSLKRQPSLPLPTGPAPVLCEPLAQPRAGPPLKSAKAQPSLPLPTGPAPIICEPAAPPMLGQPIGPIRQPVPAGLPSEQAPPPVIVLPADVPLPAGAAPAMAPQSMPVAWDAHAHGAHAPMVDEPVVTIVSAPDAPTMPMPQQAAAWPTAAPVILDNNTSVRIEFLPMPEPGLVAMQGGRGGGPPIQVVGGMEVAPMQVVGGMEGAPMHVEGGMEGAPMQVEGGMEAAPVQFACGMQRAPMQFAGGMQRAPMQFAGGMQSAPMQPLGMMNGCMNGPYAPPPANEPVVHYVTMPADANGPWAPADAPRAPAAPAIPAWGGGDVVIECIGQSAYKDGPTYIFIQSAPRYAMSN